MKEIWKQLDRRRSEVAAHPFFAWIDSDSAPLEQRFVFAPLVIDFVMGFADMNKWFMSYADPKCALESGINEHTEEDRTHSRLFYDNWYTLNLGALATWRPGKTLWWLFQSEDSAVVRRFGMDVLDLTVNYTDPLVRFVMMEAIEVFGDVFFSHTAPLASLLSSRYGVSHLYFGEYHRERETGHLHTDEAAFEGAQLSSEQRRDAELVANRVFDGVLDILDRLLVYSKSAVADYEDHLRRLDDEYHAALSERRHDWPPRTPRYVQLPRIAAEQRPLVEQLERRINLLQAHPFLEWLRSFDGIPPIEKLRRFVALWGIDVVSYRDFNELVLRYPAPRSLQERAINAWTEDLATHGVLYLRDWEALRMDRFLQWDAGEAIAFYFLSEQTEIHRHNMARVKKYAFRYKQPLVRWWLMRALESSGETLFASTAPLAEAVEAEQDIVLDYWADRHHLAHESGARAQAPLGLGFLDQGISSLEQQIASELIEIIFDNMEEQFALSHREAISGVFLYKADTLPPPRHSGVVARLVEGAEKQQATNRNEGVR